MFGCNDDLTEFSASQSVCDGGILRNDCVCVCVLRLVSRLRLSV